MRQFNGEREMIYLPPQEMERRLRADRRRRVRRAAGAMLFRVTVLAVVLGLLYAWYTATTPRQWLDALLSRWQGQTDPDGTLDVNTPSDPSEGRDTADSLTRQQLYLWDADAILAGARAVIPVDLCEVEQGLPTGHTNLSAIPELSADGEVQILILHAHSREAYLPEGTASVEWEANVGRTRIGEVAGSVVDVGQTLAAALRKKGVGVLHLTQAFDAPGNVGAFARAKEAVEQILAQYPHIRLVIDLHRDAGVNEDGDFWRAVTLYGEPSRAVAQLRCTAPAQEGASALATGLYELLNRRAEHLCRPSQTTMEGWSWQNGDGETVAVLRVEVGTTGNSVQEARASGEILAEALCALMLEQ